MDDPTKPTLVHPRITKAYIRGLVAEEYVVSNASMRITVCMVRLKNGHRLAAHAICGNAETFNADRGVEVARRKIYDRILENELYLLHQKLYEKSLTKESSDGAQ